MIDLITADLHMTDKAQDKHRWDLWPWLAEMARKHKVKRIMVLGDLTDAKDKHPASVTNGIARGLRMLGMEAPTHVIRGNHDYIDEGEPFFGFARGLNAKWPIEFYTKPEILDRWTICLPNTRNYKEAWKDLDFSKWDLVYCHQSFDGSISETGYHLEGIPPSLFAKAGYVYAGDVHKPQKVSKVIEHVGAPYRTRFGDDYKPRVLLVADSGNRDLHFNTKNKILIDVPPESSVKAYMKRLDMLTESNDVREGDQVKIRVHMRRQDFADWPQVKALIRDAAKDQAVELTGPELVCVQETRPKQAVKGQPQAASGDVQGPLAALDSYCASKGLSQVLAGAGKALLEATLKGHLGGGK